MSDNPFKKIIEESVSKVDKVARSIIMLEQYLVQASAALNESISGQHNVNLQTTYAQGTLDIADTFRITSLNPNPKTKFIYLTNGFYSKIIAVINFNDNGEDMSLSIEKLKSTYSTSDDGFISCISSILSTTSITDLAVKLRRKTRA